MSTVGTAEAKGERIVDRGKPVAQLVPPELAAEQDAARIGRDMLAYRDQVKRTLKSSLREMAHEGHRY